MNLILFFNGWGMDTSAVSHLTLPKNYELAVIGFPYTIDLNLTKYEHIIPIGWSFGCYYLSKFIIEHDLHFGKIIAINGNGDTIGANGISPKMFDLTLHTLTPESLQQFYLNMGIDENFIYPDKNFADIKEELTYFKANFQPLKNIFTKAFIGKGDRIIPFSRQKRYFQKNNVPIKEMNTAHYPFAYVSSWQYFIDDEVAKDEF